MNAAAAGVAAALRRPLAAQHRGLLALLVATIMVLVAAGSPAADESWHAPFAGTWTGQGRFMGNEASYEIAVAPTLDARFVRLSVRYRWRDTNGAEASFAGEGTYPAARANTLRGAWIDSEGHHFSTAAYLEGPQAFIVHWGEGSLRGRTEYRVLASGELTVSDSMQREGKWEGFSSARLVRGAKGG